MLNHEKHEKLEKVNFREEGNALQGAIFEVYRKMGSGLLVNFSSFPKVGIERIVL